VCHVALLLLRLLLLLLLLLVPLLPLLLLLLQCLVFPTAFAELWHIKGGFCLRMKFWLKQASAGHTFACPHAGANLYACARVHTDTHTLAHKYTPELTS